MGTATAIVPRMALPKLRSLAGCSLYAPAATFSPLFSSRRVSSVTSARRNRNLLVGYMSLASSNSKLFQHVAMVSLLGRMPVWSNNTERVMTMASLAADQETVIDTKSEVEIVEEKKLIVLPTNESSENLLKIRHTSAHVLAMAVQKLFPDAQVTIGPWIEKGFYYDFDMKEAFTEKDLKKIKKEMDRIISRNLPLTREEVSREEAEVRIKAINEPYKLEILEGIKSEPITIYKIGEDWWDLCAGPHLERTGQLNRRAIELEFVAGAYWRGDSRTLPIVLAETPVPPD